MRRMEMNLIMTAMVRWTRIFVAMELLLVRRNVMVSLGVLVTALELPHHARTQRVVVQRSNG